MQVEFLSKRFCKNVFLIFSLDKNLWIRKGKYTLCFPDQMVLFFSPLIARDFFWHSLQQNTGLIFIRSGEQTGDICKHQLEIIER